MSIRWKWYGVGGIMWLGILGSGCQMPKPMDIPAPVTVSQGQSCAGMVLAVNQRLIVELASNPSTGYEWQVAAVPAFLTIEDDGVYLPDAAPAGLVGSGGVMRRSFQANATGQGELKLVYVHPWETDATPAQTFVCPVRVESTNSSQ